MLKKSDISWMVFSVAFIILMFWGLGEAVDNRTPEQMVQDILDNIEKTDAEVEAILDGWTPPELTEGERIARALEKLLELHEKMYEFVVEFEKDSKMKELIEQKEDFKIKELSKQVKELIKQVMEEYLDRGRKE